MGLESSVPKEEKIPSSKPESSWGLRKIDIIHARKHSQDSLMVICVRNCLLRKDMP